MRVAIEGMGLVGAFGAGREAFAAALGHGQTQPQVLAVGNAGEDAVHPALCAEVEGLDDFVAARALRRVDHFSSLALLAAGLALRDGGVEETDKERLGIAVGTGYGATDTTFAFMDSMVEHGDACASPTRFSASVHNSAASNISILMGVKGPSLSVSHFEMSVPAAMTAAFAWLAEGSADAVLLGGVDQYCRQLGYCYHRFFGEHDGAMAPLDLQRQTAIPGEGAAFFVLRRIEDAVRPLAVIEELRLGCGVEQELGDGGGEIILGADGHRRGGSHYAAVVDKHPGASCYSPVYGSLPVGPAFDLAAAVHLLERESDRVRCLKIDCSGFVALITLSKGETTGR